MWTWRRFALNQSLRKERHFCYTLLMSFLSRVCAGVWHVRRLCSSEALRLTFTTSTFWSTGRISPRHSKLSRRRMQLISLRETRVTLHRPCLTSTSWETCILTCFQNGGLGILSTSRMCGRKRTLKNSTLTAWLSRWLLTKSSTSCMRHSVRGVRKSVWHRQTWWLVTSRLRLRNARSSKSTVRNKMDQDAVASSYRILGF